jgi:hypothetical protein
MAQKNGGATADNSGPAHVLSAQTDKRVYSTKALSCEGRNGPAPLHLLVDHRLCRCTRTNGRTCGCVPVVATFPKGGSVVVGVRNPPWGFGGSRFKECLTERSAQRYEAELWLELRALAWREYDRRERNRAEASR